MKLASTEANVTDAIAEALSKQQISLETTVQKAIRVAMEDVKSSLIELRQEVQSQTNTVRDLISKVDKVQGETRQMKKDLNMCTTEQQNLTSKIAELEDRSRRNNVRLVGLQQGREGDDPIGFLQMMLPTWIPALKKKGPIEIDRAHRIYGSGKSRTLIFRVLRYQDRQAILQGAREVMKTEPIRDQDNLLRFFADYSGFTSRRRQAFGSIQKELHALGIPNFLIYPAILRVSSGGNQHSFDSVKKAEEFLEEARNSHASGARRKLAFHGPSPPPESMDE